MKRGDAKGKKSGLHNETGHRSHGYGKAASAMPNGDRFCCFGCVGLSQPSQLPSDPCRTCRNGAQRRGIKTKS